MSIKDSTYKCDACTRERVWKRTWHCNLGLEQNKRAQALEDKQIASRTKWDGMKDKQASQSVHTPTHTRTTPHTTQQWFLQHKPIQSRPNQSSDLKSSCVVVLGCVYILVGYSSCHHSSPLLIIFLWFLWLIQYLFPCWWRTILWINNTWTCYFHH